MAPPASSTLFTSCSGTWEFAEATAASWDLFLAQRFARHVSPLTTTVYTHPSDEELWQGVRGLTC